EKSPIEIFVYEGSSPEGPVVRTLTATISKGSWSSGPVSPTLPAGTQTYTVEATAATSIDNLRGHSAPQLFVINTQAPVVKLTAPSSPTNNTKPAFSGSASENTEVRVSVKLGVEEIASATTTASNGSWSTPALSKALPSGRHTFTAVATEKSAITGNAEG